jgi:hypothetical protein
VAAQVLNWFEALFKYRILDSSPYVIGLCVDFSYLDRFAQGHFGNLH